MSKDKQTSVNISFLSDKPTPLTFAELYSWIIWQFPQKLDENWLCGAIKPPIPKTEWLPATINHKEKRALIYAHLSKTFATPQEAANCVRIG